MNMGFKIEVKCVLSFKIGDINVYIHVSALLFIGKFETILHAGIRYGPNIAYNICFNYVIFKKL
jgi:hypothetical protein